MSLGWFDAPPGPHRTETDDPEMVSGAVEAQIIANI